MAKTRGFIGLIARPGAVPLACAQAWPGAAAPPSARSAILLGFLEGKRQIRDSPPVTAVVETLYLWGLPARKRFKVLRTQQKGLNVVTNSLNLETFCAQKETLVRGTETPCRQKVTDGSKLVTKIPPIGAQMVAS